MGASDPPPAPSPIEVEIRGRFDAGDLEGAAAAAVEGYGPEVLGFLIALTESEHDADEVFSQLSEDLWRGLERFEWRSSFRTWMYTLARNAWHRFRRTPHHRPERRAGLSRLSEVADRVRSQTLPHLRTEVKDRFQEIRRSLDPDDQELLILRIDRQMTWNEIARVLADEDGDPARLAARYRKRFQALKDQLRDRAKAEGLLNDD